MKGIAILGSTGSIGQSALAVVDAHPKELRVVGLAAGGNAARLDEQVKKYRPSRSALAADSGPECLIEIATHPDADIVLFASSGTAALDAVLAAIDAGKTIALANKEILVMAGSVVMAAAQRRGVMVLPVDSEHNAIHQCLHGRRPSEVKRLILTASGGPFRGFAADYLPGVTAAGGLRHPTWRMGPKITIDSATLMNKGLEVIQARWLFDVTADQINVCPRFRGSQPRSVFQCALLVLHGLRFIPAGEQANQQAQTAPADALVADPGHLLLDDLETGAGRSDRKRVPYPPLLALACL